MLERILNINAQKDYQGNRRSSNYEKFISRPIIANIFGKDSAVISPAAVFFSRLNWHLKEVNTDSKEKIMFDFFIDDLEFKTEFDFLTFFSNSMHPISIIQEITRNDQSIKSFIKLSVKKKQIYVVDYIPHFEFIALRELFKRMLKLSVEKELNLIDSAALDNLKEGLENELYSELSPVLFGLYSLIYKLDKFTLKTMHTFDAYPENLIVVEKVSKLYV